METPNGWMLDNGKLVREFSFADFKEAMGFLHMVGEIAEDMNHHPEIWNSYNKVKLSLYTHDTGATTEKDVALALKINELQ